MGPPRVPGPGHAVLLSHRRIRRRGLHELLRPTGSRPDRPRPRRAGHQYLNRTIREDRILLVGDAQPFDLQMPVLYNTCFDDSIFEQLVKDRTAAEVRAAFAERDIRYVYVDWSEVERYRRTYGMTEFVQPEVFKRLVRRGRPGAGPRAGA